MKPTRDTPGATRPGAGERPAGRRDRRSRLTIRTRLTVVYGGLFLLAGVLLLGVTYVLISQRPPAENTITVSGPTMPANAQAGTPPVTDSRRSESDDRLVRRIAEDAHHDTLNALLTQGGIALALVGAAAIGFGWLIAGRVLQPLHRMTETARRIAETPPTDHRLRDRIALAGPRDEITQLADTFDVMLERLDQSFDGQRRFIANASHELRTPLTLNRALLEVAVHRRTASEEVRQLGETLLEVNSRHERLIDGLLLLARSEREVAERSYVDLADIVEHVAAQVPPGGVTVHTTADEAPTSGNPVLLERLAQNLVENGVRHNLPEDGWVRVASSTRSDGSVTLAVSNTGPVVPPYDVAGLFEPFRRLATQRLATAPGAGLGLSIVRAIAHAHGGEVHAVPRGGGGLVVTVTLPGSTGSEDPGQKVEPDVT